MNITARVDQAEADLAKCHEATVEVVSASPQEAAANGKLIRFVRFVILWKAELDREITKAGESR